MADLAGYLFDLPLSFYRNACMTDGNFDPQKASELGYSTAQLSLIEEALTSEVAETQPLDISPED